MAWNRPNEEARNEGRGSTAGRRGVPHGIIAGSVVVLVAGIVAWFVFRSGDDSEDAAVIRDKARIREVTPAKTRTLDDSTKTEKEVKLPPKPQTTGVRREKREELPAPESLDELQATATNRPARKKAAFANASEQLLAMAMPSSPGAAVPPLPDLSHSDADKAAERDLRHVIAAEEGDSEALLNAKANVVAAKEEFHKLRDEEGYTFTEYVKALRDKANLDAEFLADAQRVTDELYHDQGVSDENYIKYRDQVNVKLRERGLPEIGVEKGNEDHEEESKNE